MLLTDSSQHSSNMLVLGNVYRIACFTLAPTRMTSLLYSHILGWGVHFEFSNSSSEFEKCRESWQAFISYHLGRSKACCEVFDESSRVSVFDIKAATNHAETFFDT